MAGKNSIAQQLISMTTSDIKSLKAYEAKKMVKAARDAIAEATQKLYKASYTKSGKLSQTFYSSAYENLTEWTGKHFKERAIAPSRLKRVEAVSELQAYKKFFDAKSSTVKGAREIMRQQDARIFGTDASGNPLQRMSRKQRENFWSLYDEFMTGDTTAELAYRNYGSLQQEIGKIVKERKKDPETGKFKSFDLGEAMTELRRRLGDEKYDTSSNDIFSGDWSNW